MMSSEEERFRELGLECPDFNFMKKELGTQERWGLESKYNTRTLEGNWYEDRRGYKQICPRCTGHSITRTDYLPNCKEAYSKNDTFPPPIYDHRLKQEGEGVNFLRNTEDYCDYLENYTTTYDLMHNWEVRRAGCKPKPWRRWKLVKDNTWFPERDNALAYGNLTQIGYRQAPQLPLLPNDWDVYANVSTTYAFDYAPLKYPDDFVHCRAAATKEIRRANEEICLVKVPNPCFKCKEEHKSPMDEPCKCVCHAIDEALKECGKNGAHHKRSLKPLGVPRNAPRFSGLMQANKLAQNPGVQTLYSGDTSFPYRTLKHPPHLPQGPCKPNCAAMKSTIPGFQGRKDENAFHHPDICHDYAGDVRRE